MGTINISKEFLITTVFKFQLAITLSMVVILNCITLSAFAVSIHHSGTSFVQGNCHPEFFLDAGSFSDEEITNMEIVVTAVDASGKTIDSGSLIIAQIGGSSANRYKTDSLHGGIFCNDFSIFIITKATGKINGKQVDLLSKNLLDIEDFKPVPVKIKAVQEESADHRCNAEAIIIDEDPKGLNVRDAPSGKGQIISRIPYSDGSIVHIIDAKKGWFKIDGWEEFNLSATKFNDDIEAWVYGKLLLLGEKGGGITLYTQPSTQSSIKGKVGIYPEIKKLLDCQDGWLLVEVKLENSKRLRGWLAPEEQCTNPVSTCS
jgi:hypothetical protein